MDSQEGLEYGAGADDQGSNHSGGNRWQTAALEPTDFVCTFLDQDEDHLPELYDVNAVEKH